MVPVLLCFESFLWNRSQEQNFNLYAHTRMTSNFFFLISSINFQSFMWIYFHSWVRRTLWPCCSSATSCLSWRSDHFTWKIASPTTCSKFFASTTYFKSSHAPSSSPELTSSTTTPSSPMRSALKAHRVLAKTICPHATWSPSTSTFISSWFWGFSSSSRPFSSCWGRNSTRWEISWLNLHIHN